MRAPRRRDPHGTAVIAATASQTWVARCACGGVEFEAAGAPIVSAACYCSSCQSAGRQFEQLASAPKTRDEDGGTPYSLFRKDRVRCTKGGERLQDHRLTPDSPTRRVLATCCNSPMFLDFTKGHWLSMYRARFQSGMPAIEMRVMTGERPAGTVLAGDIPNHKGFSGKFLWRLLKARIAMLAGW